MRRTLALVSLTMLLLTACSSDSTSTAEDTGEWGVEVVADGLEHPWGLSPLPDGALLVTERPGRLSLVVGGEVRPVEADLGDVEANGEGGLTGLALSPTFIEDSTFYVCSNTTNGDIQVIPFVLSEDRASAQRQEALVTGLPMASSGRHSGCRLRIGIDEMLYVGTGDTAQGTLPQDLTSLGGKVLRVDPATGEPPPDNPFIDSDNPTTRLIYSYGHRNVQGLAVRYGTDEIYAVEHGPDVDDEVNLLEPGANYGWNPVGSGSYDESVPMTDDTIDGAVPAVWSSGSPTIATSGAGFLVGVKWGENEGTLAIATLKGSALYLLSMPSPESSGYELTKAGVLDGDYGRLRTIEPDGNGVLYVTTSNGTDDKILKLTP